MSKSVDNWIDYWNSLAPRLNGYIDGQSCRDAELFLTSAFGFFCYLTEDFHDKATLHKNVGGGIDSIIVETMDLARSIIVLQRQLLMAPLALVNRTIFEIYCNQKFLLKSNDPEVSAKQFADFKQIEEWLGQKQSVSMADPLEVGLNAILKVHAEWVDAKTGKLHKKVHWSGRNGISLRDMCKEIGSENEYISIYKTNSKFAHASPVITNLYRTPKGLGFVGERNRCLSFALPAMRYCKEILKAQCSFFGVPYPEDQWSIIERLSLPVLKELEAIL